MYHLASTSLNFNATMILDSQSRIMGCVRPDANDTFKVFVRGAGKRQVKVAIADQEGLQKFLNGEIAIS